MATAPPGMPGIGKGELPKGKLSFLIQGRRRSAGHIHTTDAHYTWRVDLQRRETSGVGDRNCRRLQNLPWGPRLFSSPGFHLLLPHPAPIKASTEKERCFSVLDSLIELSP